MIVLQMHDDRMIPDSNVPLASPASFYLYVVLQVVICDGSTILS